MTTLTIPAGAAAELYELEDGEQHGEWTRLADQHIDSGRWMERHWLVVSNGGGCFGIRYEIGLTEEQENELPWEEYPDRPIGLVPLVGVPVVQTRYLTEKEYEDHRRKQATS